VITLVTAPPGNGKSAYAVRAIARALESGKPVATNIHLRADFAEFVARRGNAVRQLVPGRVGRVAAVRDRQVFVSDDVRELARVRLRGYGESRGLQVWDETPDFLNAHDWSGEDVKALSKFGRKHRHLGWDILILAQDEDMIAKQVRVNYESQVHMRNLKRAKVAGVSIFPFNYFVATSVWHQKRGAAAPIILGRETFALGWWKDLYDTHQAAGEVEDDPDAVWLPRAA